MNITNNKKGMNQMEYITIEEKHNIILGFDEIGKEYFVNDKNNHAWMWFKSLSQAKQYYDATIAYLERVKK